MSLIESIKEILLPDAEPDETIPTIEKGETEEEAEEDGFFAVDLDDVDEGFGYGEDSEVAALVADVTGSGTQDGTTDDAAGNDAAGDGDGETTQLVEVTELAEQENTTVIMVGSDVEFDEEGHATVMQDGVAYDIYDMSAKIGGQEVEVPVDEDGNLAPPTIDDVTEATEEDGGSVVSDVPDDKGGTSNEAAEVIPPDSTANIVIHEAVLETTGEQAEEVAAAVEQTVAPTLRVGDSIVPLGLNEDFEANCAEGDMLGRWHVRVVNETDMPDYPDEPIVELYDGETGEFVSTYWVSMFCDNSGEREGQGLACRGADRRYRIAYDDLVCMQEVVMGCDAVAEWMAAHEGDMPDHSV